MWKALTAIDLVVRGRRRWASGRATERQAPASASYKLGEPAPGRLQLLHHLCTAPFGALAHHDCCRRSAHNEARHIGRCLASLHLAAQCPALDGEAVTLYVVADDCSDATPQLAAKAGAAVVTCTARNVGVARALGAQEALRDGARWLAFTDADSRVSPDWLAQQHAQASDAVCGTVEVRDWRSWGALQHGMRTHFAHSYCDADGHRHIHGANLGVSAEAYRKAGGFAALASSEDVALVQALQHCGARIAWSAAPRVTTSARRRYRAPGGFGATLAQVAQQAIAAGPVTAGAAP